MNTTNNCSWCKTPVDKEGKQPCPVHVRALHTCHQMYRAKFGRCPNTIEGRDKGILRVLVGKYGVDEVLETYRLYLESTDPFIERNGHTMGIFSMKWDAIQEGHSGRFDQLAEMRKAKEMAHHGQCR